MGASYYWTPVDPVKGNYLHVEGSRSGFYTIMENAFGGESPWQLTTKDIPKLEGMMHVSSPYGKQYEELISALCDNDVIEVWAQY